MLGDQIGDQAILLNKQFRKYQILKSMSELCELYVQQVDEDGEPIFREDGEPEYVEIEEINPRTGKKEKRKMLLPIIEKALSNIKNLGLSQAVSEMSEHTQTSAFVSARIKKRGGGIKGDPYADAIDFSI